MGAIAAIVAALGAAAGAAWFWLRNRSDPAIRVPQLQRPDLDAAAAAKPPATPAPAADKETEEDAPLSLALEAREMAITLTAATLSYRVTLTNMSKEVMEGVTVMGDMISAHASLPEEQQLATDDSELATKHVIQQLRPGESMQVTGEFRLNFPAIRPIRKGSALMFVPLARLRVETASSTTGAIMRTALVGQRSLRPGAGLQPFRLDLGPRIYREVTQRIF
ncbi:MAG TPA: hypothetical protein VEZ26_09600 [Sphingomonadaceae bacterium]|nr:hypothetical protein [Sphingomonadaceae bacterium]